MNRSLARLILIGGVAIFGASAVRAEDVDPAVDPPALEEMLLTEPAQIQPIGQPTVSGIPFARPAYLPIGQSAIGLPAVPTGKEFIPRERHWKFVLGLTIGASYDDNIFLTDKNKEHDFIFAISPIVGIQFGDSVAGFNNLTITYSPTFVFFADHSDENSIEHAVELRFVRQTDIWKFAGNASFLYLNGSSNPLQGGGGAPHGEIIGERVNRMIYVLGLKYNYALSDKTSFEIGLAGTHTDYEDLQDTTDVVSQNFIDYAITGKTSLGIGFGIGYSQTEGGSGQYYEQALARVRYDATYKLKFELHGGGEFRQTDGGGGDEFNGIFGLSLTYDLSDRTSFILAAYRNVNPSSVAGDLNYTATGVSISARQTIHDKLSLVLSTGYENSEYQSFGGSSPADNRSDNYVYVRPRVVYQLGQHGTIELFYEYRASDSTLNEFQFSNNRVGMSLGFAF